MLDRIVRSYYYCQMLAESPAIKAFRIQTDVLETKGQRTRNSILEVAAALATEEGLEPLSIGRLAEATAMSKSGLFAHFGSKEELQLATVDYAARLFVGEVIDPARSAPQRLARIWPLCERT